MRVCLKHAFSKRRDGAVVIDDSLCDGCGKCEAVCPFQMIRIETTISGLKAKKCELCTDRRENGQEPACVEACTSGALLFGDMERAPLGSSADWQTLAEAGITRTYTDPSTRVTLPKPKIRYFLSDE
ncbi:Anaerobic dimethyl sulfoxide reductase chain B [Salisediminibacterium beveridgei]|uniref:Anaerobic dimethyl sulfoxide reductase chain B n=2 Tax=Salisediminibacterium beveridgei TaxID=632773 RepID=A0A1D7QX33_9BACI|nr:Anaerobic dimethyl sulfoxide reductase chain B [Salisediminibacterium beveridgei]